MSEIDWQWILTHGSAFDEDTEKKRAGYEDDEYQVTIYRVSDDVIRIDIKTKGRP